MHAAGERVLILSDCLGALDSIEAIWREGDARRLRTRERGHMLESICCLRKQLGLVVFMYVKAHTGNSMNAMADAAVKCHLGGARERLADDLRARVTSRPVLYVADSDFSSTGALQAQGERAQGTGEVIDRRLFPWVRRRAARWTHSHLVEGYRGAARNIRRPVAD